MTLAEERLSAIPTLWSVVRGAHHADHEAAREAQQRLLAQYGSAARRYLLAALRDEDAADEVFQEFALRFVQGAFQQAQPDRGRFRSFLKTCLYHLIVDYQRCRKRRANTAPLDDVAAPPAEQEPIGWDDALFVRSWREELLSRAWQRLADDEQSSGKPYHTILRLRAEHAHLDSTALAALVTDRLGREISAGNLRVLVHRARELFARTLLTAVVDSLPDSRRADVEEELIELQLLEYCRECLAEAHGTARSAPESE